MRSCWFVPMFLLALSGCLVVDDCPVCSGLARRHGTHAPAPAGVPGGAGGARSPCSCGQGGGSYAAPPVGQTPPPPPLVPGISPNLRTIPATPGFTPTGGFTPAGSAPAVSAPAGPAPGGFVPAGSNPGGVVPAGGIPARPTAAGQTREPDLLR